MNEHESAAMWSLYQSGQPQGLAIKSTYKRLTQCFKAETSIFVGTVSYINYETDIVPNSNLFDPVMCKRKSFEHERELRAVCTNAGAGGNDFETYDYPPGIKISVDLNTLIEAVYVSPQAPAWFGDLVRQILKRYQRHWRVNQSNLDDDPIY
ncbi:hypothetical protein QN239_20355 [Mycolicibacterium sp. Y3]